MLDAILKCLSVVGIVLLVLVILLLAVLLLVLFFPVTYRLHGTKNVEKLELSARMNWLFGLLRVHASYPEPGMLTVKLLWFKLYRMKLPPEGNKEEKDEAPPSLDKEPGREGDRTVNGAESGPAKASGQEKTMPAETPGRGEATPESRSGQDKAREEGASGPGEALPEDTPKREESREEGASGPGEALPEGTPKREESREKEASGQEESGSGGLRDGFFEKFQKIKYTICSLYDKIKEIWKNISYYTALLQEENTRQLWAYAKQRAAKILKSIRPRHIRADVLFGTGSPDTTGYAYGMYCMFSPVLGPKVLVTPDFERTVLEGRLDISGHITIFVLVINIARLMMDKKLRVFVRKLKKKGPAEK